MDMQWMVFQSGWIWFDGSQVAYDIAKKRFSIAIRGI
jgi:hypothetical protein